VITSELGEFMPDSHRLGYQINEIVEDSGGTAFSSGKVKINRGRGLPPLRRELVT
jgi:hypothetical protein